MKTLFWAKLQVALFGFCLSITASVVVFFESNRWSTLMFVAASVFLTWLAAGIRMATGSYIAVGLSASAAGVSLMAAVTTFRAWPEADGDSRRVLVFAVLAVVFGILSLTRHVEFREEKASEKLVPLVRSHEP